MPKNPPEPSRTVKRGSIRANNSSTTATAKTNRDSLFLYVSGLRDLSKMIQEFKGRDGWSWNNLAEWMGVSPTTVMDSLVHYKRFPHPNSIPKLAAALAMHVPGWKLNAGQIWSVIYGQDYKRSLTDKNWPYYPMPPAEEILKLWPQMPTQDRLRIAPELLELIARDMNCGSEQIPGEVRLANLTQESFASYNVGADGISKKCQEYGYEVPSDDVRKILHFLDPLSEGDLNSVALLSLAGLGQCIRNQDGAAKGNVGLTLELAGRTKIGTVLKQFMSEKGIDSVEELLDWAIERDGFDFSATERKTALISLEGALSENRIPLQHSPAYHVLAAVGADLGILDADEFMRVLAKGSLVEVE